MTKKERIIVSAYTGILMCEFNELHKYIEEKFGRPVFTHELAEETMWKQIKELSKKDFLELCE